MRLEVTALLPGVTKGHAEDNGDTSAWSKLAVGRRFWVTKWVNKNGLGCRTYCMTCCASKLGHAPVLRQALHDVVEDLLQGREVLPVALRQRRQAGLRLSSKVERPTDQS